MGEAFTDPWSLTHAGWGFIAAKSGLFNWFTFLLAHTIFEIWENSEHGIQWFQDMGFPRYEGDTLLNSLGDTVWAMFGFWVGEMK